MPKPYGALLFAAFLSLICSPAIGQVTDAGTRPSTSTPLTTVDANAMAEAAAHAANCKSAHIETMPEYLPCPSSIQDTVKRNAANISTATVLLKEQVGLGSPNAVPWLTRQLTKDKASTALTNALAQIAEAESQSLQNGSNASSSASTNVASKSMSTVLGIAEETGAVSSTTSGNNTTLTVNVQQLANFLSLGAQPCYIVSADCTVGSLLTRGASISVSLSPSAQNNGLSSIANATLSGLTGVQTPAFNSLSLKESLHGRRRSGADPKASKSDQKALENALATVDSKLSGAVAKSFAALQDELTANNAAYANVVQSCAEQLIEANSTTGIQDALAATWIIEEKCAQDIYASVKDASGLSAKLQAYLSASDTYATARDAALEAAFYPNSYSLEYDLTNNAAQPLTSTFKFIYGYTRAAQKSSSDANSGADASKTGQLQITLNGGATIYNTLEGSTESRLRSAQGAAQIDWKPYSARKLEAELSGGYYFQYMVANGLLDLPSTALAPGTSIALPSGASTLLNTTGPIHIGQGKLTLSIKGTNFKIPIAVTGASRTDLIKTQDRVGANFGISYDFSSLFSK